MTFDTFSFLLGMIAAWVIGFAALLYIGMRAHKQNRIENRSDPHQESWDSRIG